MFAGVTRKRAVTSAPAVGLAFGIGAALADASHFITINYVTGTLTCSWADLGVSQLIHYACSADATATYVCVNRGAATASAQSRTTVSGVVTSSGKFNYGKNGQTIASLTLSPPAPGSFSCPRGQGLEVALVAYKNVVLSDTTTPVSIRLGNFATDCLLPDVTGACR